jgi:hypothetical protein
MLTTENIVAFNRSVIWFYESTDFADSHRLRKVERVLPLYIICENLWITVQEDFDAIPLHDFAGDDSVLIKRVNGAHSVIAIRNDELSMGYVSNE